MKLRLKKLRDQVVVLTGASSGIGLTTARMAARRGARLVLAARSAEELDRLAHEITENGGSALPVTADVGNEEDVRRVAEAALQRYGGFDTWINDAGVGIFGPLEEVSIEDSRRLFETNFWGMVYGSLTAVRHLKQRGGALINLGSVASDRAFPLQGMYSASKHAVKGFTDTLRMELEKEGAPVSVTLIKPTAIGTPFARNAKNYLADEPTLPPPIYAPEQVARAILHAAEHPVRDLFVGDAAPMQSAMGINLPRLTDWLMRGTMFGGQHTGAPPSRDREGGLHRPSHQLSERGEYPDPIHENSPYTYAETHPLAAGAAVLGAGLAVGAIWSLIKAGRREEQPVG